MVMQLPLAMKVPSGSRRCGRPERAGKHPFPRVRLLMTTQGRSVMSGPCLRRQCKAEKEKEKKAREVKAQKAIAGQPMTLGLVPTSIITGLFLVARLAIYSAGVDKLYGVMSTSVYMCAIYSSVECVLN